LDIEPWGRDFPFPVFSSKFTPVSLRPLGDGTHLKLELSKAGRLFPAIWFNAVNLQEDAQLLLTVGEDIRLVYKLQDNWYRGRRSLQLQVLATDAA